MPDEINLTFPPIPGPNGTRIIDYCWICQSTSDLGWLTLKTGDQIALRVCMKCNGDKPKIKDWFLGQLEAVLNASPFYEKQSDGRYRYLGED